MDITNIKDWCYEPQICFLFALLGRDKTISRIHIIDCLYYC